MGERFNYFKDLKLKLIQMMFIGEGYRRLGDSKNAIRYFKKAYKRKGNINLLSLNNGLKEGVSDLPVLTF